MRLHGAKQRQRIFRKDLDTWEYGRSIDFWELSFILSTICGLCTAAAFFIVRQMQASRDVAL